MATSEVLNEDENYTQDDTVEDELQDIQTATQKRRNFIYRAGCILCALFMLVSIIMVVAWSQAGGCKNGEAVCGDESIMTNKDHGSCVSEVQNPLKWDCDRDTADHICCFNRNYAEYSGYWITTLFLDQVNTNNITTFYDSVTGKALFKAPIGRTFDEFKQESTHHGWPSFRDEEVIWDNVRVLPDGETVSVDGTHLGHNIPDFSGNRYCINLVSIAGYDAESL